MMTHLGEELSVYLDGELSPPEARRVTAHLAGCDHCRDEMSDLIDIRARLRSLPMMDYVWQPSEGSQVIELRRRPRLIAGTAAAAVAVIVALATLTAPRDVIALSQGDFSPSYVARQSLDPNSSGRLIPPDVLGGVSSGEDG